MSLADFGPLSRAERLLLTAVESGGIARVGYRRPQVASPDVTIRAGFLAHLARGGEAGRAAAVRRIELLGAWIVGRLDLQNILVPTSLWLYRCAFDTAPSFDGARVAGSLSLPDCEMPGFSAEHARIAGSLALNTGCRITGEVRLGRASIGSDLNCERAHFGCTVPSAHRIALSGDGLCVGGDMLIGSGFEADGEVRLVAARVDGDVRAINARLNGRVDGDGARQVALNLDRIRLAGSLVLDGGFTAAGTVRLERARIAGDFDACEAAFDAVGDASWSDGVTLLLDGARIGGKLKLCRLQTPLLGASLAGARVGSLVDDATTWGERQVLDGFRYHRLADGAPTDARFRLAWLARQQPAHLGDDLRLDPWRHLIKVLRRMGHDHVAGAVAMRRETLLRDVGRVGAGAPLSVRWLPRLGHRLFGVFAGYGYRPMRLVATMVLVWLGCAAIYGAAAGQGAMASTVNPLLFSLERLLPLIDLLQGRAPVWPQPASGLSWHALLHWVVVLEVLLGWAASLTLVASIAGWADRDRKA